MVYDVLMPKIGLTMTEGTIAEWHKDVGSPVSQDDLLFSVETEKLVNEIAALHSGIVAEILVSAMETAAVGTVIARIADAGEMPATSLPPSEASLGIAAARKADTSGKRIIATPVAKKIAAAYGVDLAEISGGGPAGRITKADVEAAISHKPADISLKESATLGVCENRAQPEVRPVAGMRRLIAQNMMNSKTQKAQAYMAIDVNASGIQSLRSVLLPAIEEKHGVRVTITDILMKLTGAALGLHPVMNTQWTDEGIVYLPEVHMGMAMAVKGGLVVPVITDINCKGIADIALERSAFAEKGKNGSLLPESLCGSTFTLSSLGMFGIDRFTAILNAEESAILAISAIIDKPWVVGGELVVAPVMSVNLTYDHRIIDGADAADFMRTLKKFMECPELLMALR